MAKFFGNVGYATTVKKVAGVFEDEIIEKSYYGDVLRNSRRLESDNKIHNDLITSNSISIVADAYAQNNFFAIKYVIWARTYWIVSEVEVQSPRLILRLGGVYNGIKATTTNTS